VTEAARAVLAATSALRGPGWLRGCGWRPGGQRHEAPRWPGSRGRLRRGPPAPRYWQHRRVWAASPGRPGGRHRGRRHRTLVLTVLVATSVTWAGKSQGPGWLGRDRWRSEWHLSEPKLGTRVSARLSALLLAASSD